jgi:hypothetical protein
VLTLAGHFMCEMLTLVLEKRSTLLELATKASDWTWIRDGATIRRRTHF